MLLGLSDNTFLITVYLTGVFICFVLSLAHDGLDFFGTNVLWSIFWPIFILMLLILLPIALYYKIKEKRFWRKLNKFIKDNLDNPP